MKKKLFVMILCLLVIGLPILANAWVSQEYVYNISFNSNHTSPTHNYIYNDMGYNYTASCPISGAYFKAQLYRDRWYGDQLIGTSGDCLMSSTAMVVRWEGVNSGDYDYYFKFYAYNNYYVSGDRANIQAEFKLLSVEG